MYLNKPTREQHAFHVAFSITLTVMVTFFTLLAICVVCMS